MRPVAIFRHSRTEGPGYFAIFLESRRIPWRLIAIDAGEEVPVSPDAFSGLCFMGGPMSVNDSLPWIEKACALVRRACSEQIPVIGHCLGGQLISKSLGGTVTQNPVKEIGWGQVAVLPGAAREQWLPGFVEQHFYAFHWHGETFSLPAGAQPLLASTPCAHQAFVLGPHLAMQCHVEMTPEMIATWCRGWHAEIGRTPLPPSVQTPEAMLRDAGTRLPEMRDLADRLYSAWIKGLRP